jgi:hypothetical protein
MGSIANKTPAQTYRDILHVANMGQGLSPLEHKPVCDGEGNPVGIALGGGMVSLDMAGGRLSNAVMVSRLSAAPYVEVDPADGLDIDMTISSARIVRFTSSGSTSSSIRFSLSTPASGIPQGMVVFSETRLIISAAHSLSIQLLRDNGTAFGSLDYSYDPNMSYLSCNVFAMIGAAGIGDPSFFVSHAQHFGG